MDTEDIKSLLSKHRLKLTSPRLKLLEVLWSSERAITHAELLMNADSSVDRVTIYRTLKLLEDIGFIHRIMGAGEVPVYALSFRKNGFKEHLHFACTKCHGVFCLHDHPMPPVMLPEQYQLHSLNLTLTGLCDTCNASVNDHG